MTNMYEKWSRMQVLPTNYDGVCLHLRLILEDPIFYFCQIDTIEYFPLKCLINSLFGD